MEISSLRESNELYFNYFKDCDQLQFVRGGSDVLLDFRTVKNGEVSDKPQLNGAHF
jgi:hypothetical protein